MKLTKKEIRLIKKMAKDYWIENNREHEDNTKEWEDTVKLLSKITENK